MNETYELKISDLYTIGRAVPSGKREIAFRPPKKGEQWLPLNGLGANEATFDYSVYMPRIILEDIPKPRRWIVIVEEIEGCKPGYFYRLEPSFRFSLPNGVNVEVVNETPKQVL